MMDDSTLTIADSKDGDGAYNWDDTFNEIDDSKDIRQSDSSLICAFELAYSFTSIAFIVSIVFIYVLIVLIYVFIPGLVSLMAALNDNWISFNNTSISY